MSSGTGSTAKKYGFVITHPAELEIGDEVLEAFITPGRKDWMQITKIPYLYYQVGEGDDDLYAWEIPGIKLLFNDDVLFDTAVDILKETTAALKTQYGAGVEFVLIDKEAMVAMQ